MLRPRIPGRRRRLPCPDSGRHRYAVSVAMHGRIVTVVKVRADGAGKARAKAVRYVAANLYALRLTAADEADGGEP